MFRAAGWHGERASGDCDEDCDLRRGLDLHHDPWRESHGVARVHYELPYSTRRCGRAGGSVGAGALIGDTSRKGNLRTLRARVSANGVTGPTGIGGWILRFVP